METNELETGIIRGKRKTMISVSSWLSRRLELARRTSATEDPGKVLELTLLALDTLCSKMDEQIRNGVKTIDCSDFLPE